MTKELIVSVHLPKTGGASFNKSLTDHFNDRLLKDYVDTPMRKKPYQRNEEALNNSISIAENQLNEFLCIHGHFLPIKYLLLATKRKTRFVTWMRHPVNRLVSHYYYRKKRLINKKVKEKDGLDDKTSLEEFCLHPRFRNRYSEYLWGFPLENFDFIGITEFYEEDYNFFSERYLGAASQPYKVNTRTNNVESKESLTPQMLQKVEEFHNKDMDLYKRALDMRLRRCEAK